MMVSNKIKDLFKMHALFLVAALVALSQKLASQEAFLSTRSMIFYGIMLLLLVVYSLFWQQILKLFPLSIAYSNRAIVILWTALIGALLFDEQIGVNNLVGAIIIVIGVYVMMKKDGAED